MTQDHPRRTAPRPPVASSEAIGGPHPNLQGRIAFHRQHLAVSIDGHGERRTVHRESRYGQRTHRRGRSQPDHGQIESRPKSVRYQGEPAAAKASSGVPASAIRSAWTTAGTFMLLFLAALQDIPDDVQEAAMVDGTTTWQRFRAVTLPALKPTLFLVLTLGLIGTWQVFD